MEALVERTLHQLEAPAPPEKVVHIDGQIPFANQFESFQRQLAALTQDS